jgi:dTDP-4-amino-4,6-dideoxygalactose transaminase
VYCTPIEPNYTPKRIVPFLVRTRSSAAFVAIIRWISAEAARMLPSPIATLRRRFEESDFGRRWTEAGGWPGAVGVAWRRYYLRALMRWPRSGWRERRTVRAVLRSGRWGGYPFPGPWTRRFSRAFASMHAVPHVIPASSGATALLAAYQSLGLMPGDEVVVPALTFSATATAAHLLGLRVAFVDIDPLTLCLDHRLVEAAIGPHTRAIVAVHLGDSMPDMDALLEIARRRGLRLVEDCAHAHGASWQGRPAGGLGDVGCFSFQTGKLMSSGEGGAITTQNDGLAATCVATVDCGRVHGGLPDQSRLGINLRLTELQAALLSCAAERFGRENAVRQRRMESLRDQLGSVEGIRLPRRDPRMTSRPAYAFQMLYLPEACGGVPRERFVADLCDAGFPATPSWYQPVYRSPEYGRLDPRTPAPPAAPACPVAESVATTSLVWIPHPFFLGPQRHITRLARTVARLIDSYRHHGRAGDSP